MLDYNTEYSAGQYDALKDIEKHGISYAADLISGLSADDPYIAGYQEKVRTYVYEPSVVTARPMNI